MLFNEKRILRFALIVMALLPLGMGLFNILNNTSGFAGTAEYAIKPLITMSDTYGNPAQTWRAITIAGFEKVALIFITTFEGIIGLLALIAFVKMLLSFSAPYEKFAKGKAALMLSCTLAILLWGFGFLVVGGDWFLSWQAKTGLLIQQSAMLYVIPCFFILLFTMLHKEDK